MRPWFDAAAGRLDPFILVLEGSVPNEQISGDGYWAAMGVDPATRRADLHRARGSTGSRRAPPPCSRSAPARRSAGSPRCGTTRPARWGCATTSAGAGPRAGTFRSSTCPAARSQPDNITETLLHAGAARRGRRSDARPRRARAARAGCSAAPCSRGAAAPASPSRASSRGRRPITAGAWSSSAARARWRSATCRSAAGSAASAAARTSGGICIACTMPGFPDKFMPFMDANPLGPLHARRRGSPTGRSLRRLRQPAIRRTTTASRAGARRATS